MTNKPGLSVQTSQAKPQPHDQQANHAHDYEPLRNGGTVLKILGSFCVGSGICAIIGFFMIDQRFPEGLPLLFTGLALGAVGGVVWVGGFAAEALADIARDVHRYVHRTS